MSAAARSNPGYVKRTLTFTVTGIPNETTGQGTQSCSILADLYQPTSAGPHHRVPVILTTNGFGGSKDDQAGLGKLAARHGYGVLSYSGLGFGGSGCRVSLDDRAHDGKAGSQLVSWLGGDAKVKAVDSNGKPVAPPNWIIHDRRDHAGHRDRYDPRLGMIGGSYGGQIQFAIAGRDPRVDAIIPIITWNNLAYSLAPNDLASRGGFRRGVTYNEAAAPGTEKFDWTSLFFGVGIEDGIQGVKVDPTRDAGCVNFIQQACVSKAQMDSQGYPDATTFNFAKKASVASYLHRIRIPTLLVQGEADTLFNLQEVVATYRALRHQHTPVKMIWQSWGHSDGTAAPGEYSSGAGALKTYEGHRFFAWFGRYLKHRHVRTGPRFAYYRDYVHVHGKGPDTKQYGTSSRYPVGHGRRLWLSGSNRLVAARKAVKAGAAHYTNPGGGSPSSYSETSAVQGGDIPNQSSPPTDAPGTFASWSSAKLRHKVDLVGIPTAKVHVSCPTCSTASPSDELQFFAKIYDVAPNGSVDLVHRLIAPVRTASLAKPVKVQLPGIVHRFKKGHRIELVLAATDAAYRNNDPTQPVTVSTSRKQPGWLRLPVVTHRRGRGH
jgi:ABC-2 type transport system ATP-binding protein